MCSICISIPCHPRCPNASEPVPVHRCEKCGEGIFAGDRYFDSKKGYICEECIVEMTADEFMELIGETFSTAKKEE